MYAIDYLGKNSAKSGPTPPTLTEISPAEARRMLEDSVSFLNRDVVASVVREYARSMASGHWNHDLADPIRIDINGRVIDGQHRLLAVIETNQPQKFYVVTGLPPESAHYMDIGRPRRHRDFLAMAGVSNCNTTAAAIRWIARYEQGAMLTEYTPVPRYAVVEYLNKHPGLHKSIEIAVQTRDVVRRTGLAAGCHYIFSKLDPEAADAFFEKLRTGLNLTERDPVYVLRQRLIDPWRKVGEVELSAMMIKAWNNTRAGTTVLRLVWVRDKEQFPTAV